MGIERFKTKAALKRHIKELLRSTEPGDNLSSEDKALLHELIELHPSADEKIGCGIRNIVVRVDPVYRNSNQFLIIRKDGTGIDFSYHVCINGPFSNKAMFIKACREAVSEDIMRFRRDKLDEGAVCPHYGMPLTEANSHAHHLDPWPFRVIVAEFIDRGFDPEKIEVEGEIKKRFTNPTISKMFRRFHNGVALLELISIEAHRELFNNPPPEDE